VALDRALAGTAEADRSVDANAMEVVAALSDGERAALAGEPGAAVDGALVRKVLVMRVRVGSALASIPAPGGAVDSASVQALLAEIDGLLAQVNALLPDAAPGAQEALNRIRHALVREAIDFSEAATKVATGTAVASREQGTTPAHHAPRARVLSVARAESAPRPPRQGRLLWIALGACVVAALGYHGRQYQQRQQAVASIRSYPGAPDGMMLAVSQANGTAVLVPVRQGQLPDPAQVERFRAAQRAAGFEVRELTGGSLEIRRLPPAKVRRQP
jgi:hypothetical protein